MLKIFIPFNIMLLNYFIYISDKKWYKGLYRIQQIVIIFFDVIFYNYVFYDDLSINYKMANIVSRY